MKFEEYIGPQPEYLYYFRNGELISFKTEILGTVYMMDKNSGFCFTEKAFIADIFSDKSGFYNTEENLINSIIGNNI